MNVKVQLRKRSNFFSVRGINIRRWEENTPSTTLTTKKKLRFNLTFFLECCRFFFNLTFFLVDNVVESAFSYFFIECCRFFFNLTFFLVDNVVESAFSSVFFLIVVVFLQSYFFPWSLAWTKAYFFFYKFPAQFLLKENKFQRSKEL